MQHRTKPLVLAILLQHRQKSG